jgi:hypothetical protein
VGRLNPQSYTVFLGLIALCVMVGSAIIWWLRRDLKEDTPVTPDDVLRDLERAYFAGEMDKAEFERVTASLKASVAGPLPSKPAVEPESAPHHEPLLEGEASTSAETQPS